MSARDAVKFKSVVKVHWACILFTALCGGAERAWNLTGMDLSDGSLKPRDHAFEGDDDEENLNLELESLNIDMESPNIKMVRDGFKASFDVPALATMS
ncbi:hypothetical protein FVEN_g4525 [Fusarium venenatum]|nr:hypothetical protein FVEN_g4525 [Fusarium venenatum]